MVGALGESPEGWQGWSCPGLSPVPALAGPQRGHAVVGGGSKDAVGGGSGWQGPRACGDAPRRCHPHTKTLTWGRWA